MNKFIGFFLIFNCSSLSSIPSSTPANCDWCNFCNCVQTCEKETQSPLGIATCFEMCEHDSLYPDCPGTIQCPSPASANCSNPSFYALEIFNKTTDTIKINYSPQSSCKNNTFITNKFPNSFNLYANEWSSLYKTGTYCRAGNVILDITLQGQTTTCTFPIKEANNQYVCTVNGRDVTYTARSPGSHQDDLPKGLQLSIYINALPHLKPRYINFTFENNSNHSITITPADKGTCWTLGTGEGKLRTFTIDKTNHNLMGEFITSIDNSGNCLKAPSTLDIKFSSGSESTPLTFTLSEKNLSADPLTTTIGDKIDVEFSHKGTMASIKFMDRTIPLGPVNFEFVNISDVPINVTELNATCWNTNKNIPFSIVNKEFQQHTITTYTHIPNIPECINNVSSSLTLNFSGGKSAKQFTLTKSSEGSITTQTDTTQKDFWTSISPAGDNPQNVYILFMKPGKTN